MRNTQTLSPPSLADLKIRRPPHLTGLLARVRAPSLDRALAAGVVSWRSPAHAARALQLTSDRMRRTLARSLERLIEDTEHPSPSWNNAVIAPCREQVRDALPLIRATILRLRSDTPVDAKGVARLKALLCDSAGPCYTSIDPHALTLALQTVSQSLDVHD
jgi:hypothetical protein